MMTRDLSRLSITVGEGFARHLLRARRRSRKDHATGWKNFIAAHWN